MAAALLLVTKSHDFRLHHARGGARGRLDAHHGEDWRVIVRFRRHARFGRSILAGWARGGGGNDFGARATRQARARARILMWVPCPCCRTSWWWWGGRLWNDFGCRNAPKRDGPIKYDPWACCGTILAVCIDLTPAGARRRPYGAEVVVDYVVVVKTEVGNEFGVTGWCSKSPCALRGVRGDA